MIGMVTIVVDGDSGFEGSGFRVDRVRGSGFRVRMDEACTDPVTPEP